MKLVFDVCEYSDSLHQKYLNQADIIFCSNELYRGYIHRSTLLYPTNGLNCLTTSPEIEEDELSFCMKRNKKMDTDLIISFLRECSSIKKCVLHVVGDWRKKESFIQDVLNIGINVVDHKDLINQSQIQEVFDECNYGLNIIKYDGINSEALDYMRGQIPIINSVQGDLKQYCELWDIGKNIDQNNYKSVAKTICEENKSIQLERRGNVHNLYNTYFTVEKFFETLDKTGGSL